MFKAKIVVVGPRESGKTTISNFLGDQTDLTHSDYHPTAGVRILEFELQVDNGQREVDVEVELWDCGGSDEYESCWPAMASNADGVVIVYNPFNPSDKSQLDTCYNYFVSGQGLKEDCCTLFAHCKNKGATKNISPPLQSVPFSITNIENDSDALRDSFKKLVKTVLGKLSDSREREELSIIN